MCPPVLPLLGDRTATTPCLALPWTGYRFSRSLGLALITACWPLIQTVQLTYCTVSIFLLLSLLCYVASGLRHSPLGSARKSGTDHVLPHGLGAKGFSL